MPSPKSIYKTKLQVLIDAKEALDDLVAHVKDAYETIRIYDWILVPEETGEENQLQSFGQKPFRELDPADFIAHDVFLAAFLKWRAADSDAFAAFEAAGCPDDFGPFPLKPSQEQGQKHSVRYRPFHPPGGSKKHRKLAGSRSLTRRSPRRP
ncbi:MAG: hypothetical protein WCE23_10160 [Candidatus Binatus sp.]|uniref:hypothetical protein n=1 Tax=Candidatus Binatus sp. TaxID=2811406 RepID=UPI003C77B21F